MEMNFTLFKRKGKKNSCIYYARFWDVETDKLVKTLSTGKTSLKDATRWALEQIHESDFESKISPPSPTFTNYTENWFVWDECQFIEKQLAKGKRYSRSHADTRRGILKNHLLPYFGNKKLTNIKIIDMTLKKTLPFDMVTVLALQKIGSSRFKI